MIVTKMLTLDFERQKEIPLVTTMRGDNGLVIEAIILKSGEKVQINNSDYIYFSAENGGSTSSLLPCIFDGEKVQIAISNSLTATIGKKPCQIHIADSSGNILSSARFNLVVFESNSAVASAVASNDFSLLSQKLDLFDDFEDAETARTNAETTRSAAETARTNAETARSAAETARTNAETSRSAAETVRTNAETARSAAETARTNAETARSAAETARTNAETARASAETARQASFSAMQELLTLSDEDEDEDYSIKIKIENGDIKLILNDII